MVKKASPQKPPKARTKPATNWSLIKLFDKKHTWDDKDEVLDAVYWCRQVIAIVMGIIWGYLGITGATGIGLFALLNSLAAYMIAINTGYDFEPDETFSPIKEGFMTTFATFLVSWIVTYTAAHFSHI